MYLLSHSIKMRANYVFITDSWTVGRQEDKNIKKQLK